MKVVWIALYAVISLAMPGNANAKCTSPNLLLAGIPSDKAWVDGSLALAMPPVISDWQKNVSRGHYYFSNQLTSIMREDGKIKVLITPKRFGRDRSLAGGGNHLGVDVAYMVDPRTYKIICEQFYS